MIDVPKRNNLSSLKAVLISEFIKSLPAFILLLLTSCFAIYMLFPDNSLKLYMTIIISLIISTCISIALAYKLIYKSVQQLENIDLESHGDILLISNGNTKADKSYFGVLSSCKSESDAKELLYMDKLRISNEKLNQANEIIEKSSIVVFEWAIVPDEPIKFVTNNISLFGYSAEDFYSGRIDYWDILHEDDLSRTQNTVWDSRKKELSEYKHTYRIVCKNGNIRWVEEWTLLERDSRNNLIAEKGILRDITEQVETAQKLKESEERYRSLFENACAIIFTLDFNGCFTSANKACIDVTGYDNNELLNMNIKSIAAYENNESMQNISRLEYVLKNPDSYLEFEITSKNKQNIVLESKSTIVYKDNNPVEIQIVAQDITLRKAAEEKVNHLSYHDKLTGLYNRAYYEEFLESLVNSNTLPFSIIIGDMNGLKLANDAFGHKSGDTLLTATARIIEQVCPQDAVIARIGGDEFSIVLPHLDKRETMEICNRIRDLCSKAAQDPIQPSIALGYATRVDNSKHIKDIIREADDNMYRNKLTQSKSIRSEIISSLRTTLEEKTLETKEHAERLRELSLKLGKALDFPDNMLDELALASVMHDIGKIAIPDSILLKPGRLTDEEWATMKKHTEIGYHIILSSPKMSSVAEYILAHHERWDGTGYPQGLKGEDIPLISRVISVVDSYDVMLHSRPYCVAKSKKEAALEIKRCAGTQFDPKIAEVFLTII